MLRLAGTLTTIIVFAGCGGSSSTGSGMSGPSMSSSFEGEEGASDIQSDDILGRDAVTSEAKVKHVLIGWRDLEKHYPGELDERARKRTRQEADALAAKLLERVKAGEPIETLMAEFSEDPGSAKSGEPYTVTPDSQFMFEFKRLGLRLQVGEAGLVMTSFGWHVMKRVK